MKTWHGSAALAATFALAGCAHEHDGLVRVERDDGLVQVGRDEEAPLVRVVPGAAARALWYDGPARHLPSSGDADQPVKKSVATERPSD